MRQQPLLDFRGATELRRKFVALSVHLSRQAPALLRQRVHQENHRREAKERKDIPV
ncbi:MAG: hypothetical protein H6Q06_2894 [Acidobacteria bacterium]|nr:hypothetical protein [Acidobacteriota bacterium]